MNLEQYRSLYRKIEVPQQLSKRVLQSAEQSIPAPKTALVRWKKRPCALLPYAARWRWLQAALQSLAAVMQLFRPQEVPR